VDGVDVGDSARTTVTVTRVGTQVVVRLSGVVDDARSALLDAALGEVADLALNRVVVDLAEAVAVRGAGLDFLLRTGDRWTLRLLDPPPGLRQHLADRAGNTVSPPAAPSF
jgi:anti-anti-sigma regulatory factor